MRHNWSRRGFMESKDASVAFCKSRDIYQHTVGIGTFMSTMMSFIMSKLANETRLTYRQRQLQYGTY